MQYPGESRNELLKLTTQPIEQLRLTACYPLKVRFTILWHYSWFLEYPTAIGQVSCRISHKDAVLREKIKFPSCLLLI